MANGGTNGWNGKSPVSKETTITVGLALALAAAIWFAAHLDARVGHMVDEIDDLAASHKEEIDRLTESVDRLQRAQIRWDAKVKEASDEAYRAISRADEARVAAGVNEKLIERIKP